MKYKLTINKQTSNSQNSSKRTNVAGSGHEKIFPRQNEGVKGYAFFHIFTPRLTMNFTDSVRIHKKARCVS